MYLCKQTDTCENNTSSPFTWNAGGIRQGIIATDKHYVEHHFAAFRLLFLTTTIPHIKAIFVHKKISLTTNDEKNNLSLC